ncbi:Retrovirus-related Pol polyprotein from transposon TNT 1-94 [Sesamum angolense]|uniref:Retrovirus-related Pol polyprotein from transposon TNT 1-94 n=1 Tax=Sesamum angolense TaxID=2727404 RepID=A0AAE2C7H5_9LAMI|nr:Retrovirus-related Pol polyprotein from transposon TNT 1-94 [Sesamum angolense]
MDIDEPATYEEAVTSQNANEWMTAMKEEMSSMAKNNIWKLVDLPTGRYTQKKGIDYEETFSPVMRFATVRLILAIVAHLDLELFQMDVKAAFLNGELDEKIFMDQPEGFQEMGQKRKVCRLKRSIYGLKQSSRQWYHRFHRAITSIGFTMDEEDLILSFAVGSLMYAMMYTRPDLFFAVGMVSRDQSNPGPDHWHVDDAVVIYCDNIARIAYAKPQVPRRTKHIDTRYQFIRDSIAQGEVVLRHIPTNDMIVDPFTKPLRGDAFHRHVRHLDSDWTQVRMMLRAMECP